MQKKMSQLLMAIPLLFLSYSISAQGVQEGGCNVAGCDAVLKAFDRLESAGLVSEMQRVIFKPKASDTDIKLLGLKNATEAASLALIKNAQELEIRIQRVGSTDFFVLEVRRGEFSELVTRDAMEKVQLDEGAPVALDSVLPFIYESPKSEATLSDKATGAGVAVAVLDTGIQTGHPFLREAAKSELLKKPVFLPKWVTMVKAFAQGIWGRRLDLVRQNRARNCVIMAPMSQVLSQAQMGC